MENEELQEENLRKSRLVEEGREGQEQLRQLRAAYLKDQQLYHQTSRLLAETQAELQFVSFLNF